MEKKEFAPGTLLYETGQPIDKLLLIIEGTVTATSEWGDEMTMQKGQVVGIAGLCHAHYRFTAKCKTKVTAAVYGYSDGEITNLLKRHPEAKNYFTASITRQLFELFNQYKAKKNECINLYNVYDKTYKHYVKMCESNGITVRTLPGQDEIEEFRVDDDLEPWSEAFHKTLYTLISKAEEPAKISAEFYAGYIIKMGRSIFNVVSIVKQITEYRESVFRMIINEDRLDLFELLSAAFLRVSVLSGKDKPNFEMLDEIIALIKTLGGENKEYENRINEFLNKINDTSQNKEAVNDLDETKEQAELVRDSLGVILDYVGYSNEESDIFKKELLLYKKTANKSSTEDVDRKRRMVLSKHFYSIYSEAVLRSLDSKNIPRIIKMFLNFGYIDEELAGIENAVYLYNIVEHIPSNPDKGIFTFYEWLLAIYAGKRAPCRNEFDNDYFDYVNELKRNHKITPAETIIMMADTRKMVIYEMENAFSSANKVTYGRITTFCPVFSDHNIIKSLKQMLLSADIIENEINNICRKDYGAFCRESVFSQPENGIAKEMINTEVLPDVILFPNVGSRGVMWQEIEGKKRSTPARFMLSLFQADDINKILLRLIAEFRWEMCKRIQGARWNDASEHSLTSDYSDYIASYRKNHDLSSDVKEKIKSDLIKVKNRTKEMFIADYYSWLQYESNGSPRLNKVARMIMFAYCPFSKEIREKLRANPFYTETVDRYEAKLKNSLHYYDNLYKSLKNKGFKIPDEVAETRRLMES
ncbi:MAG: cyclic nucleotide-binding domain-containing protein [Lachnospiraceae bacterium]|nr:cyclic nucleotide-binding domain-containing protein [Lachnospiraceae bacterium]